MKHLFITLRKWWFKLGDFLHNVVLGVTFLSFLPVLVFTLYHLFWDFNLCKVIAGVIVFRILVKSNIEM